ncbi:MAG TPA: carboxypeptidase-like regulatory domain-containing protein, partial [Bryobacteraceae bacterium]|nr:carboxypeptidase-like regulatory domain-containing protein [Bryobacteraceae bacterium]
MSRISSGLICGLFVLGAASVCLGQNTTSTLGGTVTDPQGGAVPAASLTVTNLATGAVFKIQSGAEGEWTLPSLPAGSY